MIVEEVAEVLEMLGSIYPNTKYSETAPSAWMLLFHDIPKEAVMRVLPSVMEKSPEFAPTAPALRRAVVEAALGIPGWESGWQEIMTAFRRYGPNEQPEFADPVTAKAVQMMGWRSLCMSDVAHLATARAQFRTIYGNLQEKCLTAISVNGFPSISAGTAFMLEG